MLLTRKGLLSSLWQTFKLLTSNLCVKRLFHVEGYYTSPSATASSRASNTSQAGKWCLMCWKSSKIARGWNWGELSPLLLREGKWSPPRSPLFSYSQIASELRTEMQKGGLRLGGQGTDILSYFCYHHVLDQSPLLCSVLYKHTTERWAFTGSRSLHTCAAELYGLKSRSSGTALGDVLAECQGKGFAAILALGNMPGTRRAWGAILAHTTGPSSLIPFPSSD